jgi:hypothetical protein
VDSSRETVMPQPSPTLFDFIGMPSPLRRHARSLLSWLAQRMERFSFFVILSFLAHIALFSFIVVLTPATGGVPPSPAASQGRDFEIFRRSIREFADRHLDSEKLARILTTATDEDIYEAFVKAPKLDARLTDRERDSVYRMMVSEALADSKERSGERSALDVPLSEYFRGLREMPQADPEGDFALIPINSALSEESRLFKLSDEKAQDLKNLSFASRAAQNRSGDLTVQTIEGRISGVPREYFFRFSPYQSLLAIGAQLFYVIKGFPDIGQGEDQSNSALIRAAAQHQLDNISSDDVDASLKVIFMPTRQPSHSGRPSEAIRTPLVLSQGDAERILDDLMAFPDDEQVRKFDREYLQKYDPNSVGLASLTKDFIYRNLSMVFILPDPISKAFDFLEEVYYDAISQDDLAEYWPKNPRSLTGAEILFGLAASYEFERRALISLDESLHAVKSVLADPLDERFCVYNRSAKAYVLREVYRDLAAGLRRCGFASMGAVLQKYKDEQLRIYDLLMGMGGEIKSRALYALGGFYWDEGQPELALESWKSIDPSFANWCLDGIRGAMTIPTGSMFVYAHINDTLDADAAAHKSGLLDRIELFHKWEKRSANAH